MKTNKCLVIVDLQNDFVDGSLANSEGLRVVNSVAEYIKTFEGNIICTFDTHDDNYLSTFEGKNLPIKHCIKGTVGWELHPVITQAIQQWQNMHEGCYTYSEVLKTTFGYPGWSNESSLKNIDEIHVCGLVTDICVISNVLGLKEHMPDVDIIVHGNLCAGLSREAHDAALMVMKSCQVKVV